MWLTSNVIAAMHEEAIRLFGGSYGIRDDGLIESALARPRDRWSYDESADLCALAAAYGYGLAKNHGFIDGNKRIAFLACYTFLDLSGLVLEAKEVEVVSVMLAVADGSMSELRLAAWLRSKTGPG